MRIGGHGLREHLQLLAPLFGFIAAVWALRIVLYAAGAAPFSIALRVVSVTVAGMAAILVAVIMIHHRRFGGYANVVAAVFLLTCWEEFLMAAAIAFTAVTGVITVYRAPQFSFGASPWLHVAGHLTIGIGADTILGAAVGCAVFWMLRKADPAGRKAAMGSRR